MATTSARAFRWMTAEPLWDGVSSVSMALRQPALLRFETEDFIEKLSESLNPKSSGVIDLEPLLARYEVASERPPGADSTWDRPPDGTPIRLYQPAHGRFYLVAASLVCELPGLPDHCVDLAAGDKVFFVLRRIEENETTERAWTGNKWASLTNGGTTLVEGEQELPLSAIAYQNAQGRRRRLFVGFVPTASREAAEAQDLFEEESPKGLADAAARILDPYAQLFELSIPDPGDIEAYQAAIALRKEAVRFFLLDTADFIAQRLPALWGLIQSSAGVAPATAKVAARSLFDYLQNFVVGTVPSPSRPGEARQSITWRDALNAAWAQASLINGTTPPSDAAQLLDVEWDVPAETEPNRSAKVEKLVSDLDSLITAVLEESPPPSDGWSEQRKLEFPKLQPIGNTRYVLRCVYRQASCIGIRPELVSEPTQPFTVAPYYDPDAPARPIRIAMPTDTSIAGLRKSKKNVAFVFSDKLGGQIARATDLSTAFKGKVGKGGGYKLGRICSFSIPIITLCAMIVLMIFINLLNIVFWWKPFLKICLPIPKRG